MIQKKICMIGTFAVGKTSLVQRYVNSIFSEKYLTSVGVKVDKKVMRIYDQEVMLMVWDLAGEDEFCEIRPSYVRGSSGYLLVCDGTRIVSFKDALCLHDKIRDMLGDVPFVLALNKYDLKDQWKLEEPDLNNLVAEGWSIVYTSAKTGEGVDEAFQKLGQLIIARAGAEA
jgi:hypothetical protein